MSVLIAPLPKSMSLHRCGALAHVGVQKKALFRPPSPAEKGAEEYVIVHFFIVLLGTGFNATSLRTFPRHYAVRRGDRTFSNREVCSCVSTEPFKKSERGTLLKRIPGAIVVIVRTKIPVLPDPWQLTSFSGPGCRHPWPERCPRNSSCPCRWLGRPSEPSSCSRACTGRR